MVRPSPDETPTPYIVTITTPISDVTYIMEVDTPIIDNVEKIIITVDNEEPQEVSTF